MLDRKKCKSFAKQQLKGRYGITILITALILIINVLLLIPSYIKLYQSSAFLSFMNNPSPSDYDLQSVIDVYNDATPLWYTLIIFCIATILEVASLNVYIKISKSPEKVTFSHFLDGLNDWGRAVLAGIWKQLWIIIWSALFIIPGIIKSIEYSQMYFIIAEHKEVSARKAMKISMYITKGHKLDLFVMYLSFFGLILLSSLTMGIGYIFTIPYMNMTLINAYHFMLKEALNSDIISMEDLSE